MRNVVFLGAFCALSACSSLASVQTAVSTVSAAESCEAAIQAKIDSDKLAGVSDLVKGVDALATFNATLSCQEAATNAVTFVNQVLNK